MHETKLNSKLDFITIFRNLKMEAGMYQQQRVMILKHHVSGSALPENLLSKWYLIIKIHINM